MRVKSQIFCRLSAYTGKGNAGRAGGRSEGNGGVDLLEALCAARGALGRCSLAARMREDVNVLVTGKNIAALQGMQTKLADGDEVAIFPAAIGG